MTDCGWTVVSAFEAASLPETGAPLALWAIASDANALKIRKNLLKGFTGLRRCCSTFLAFFIRLSRCKIATSPSFNPTTDCRRGECRIVCVSEQIGGAGAHP